MKRAGIQANDLLKIFNTCIRPSLEYVAPTFPSMLTKEQTEKIENVQKRASKIIFGWNADYNELVDQEKIVPLSKRREKLTVNFAKKAAASNRFGGWFEKKIPSAYDIRNEKTYVEHFARTERLRKSPLYYMRRRLNEEENQ